MISIKFVKLTKSPKLYKGDKYCQKELFLKKTTESRYKTRGNKGWRKTDTPGDGDHYNYRRIRIMKHDHSILAMRRGRRL